MVDRTVGKDHPYGLLDHGGHFFAEEFMVLISGLVWSPGNSGIILRCGPWGGREYDRGAMLGDVTEETFSRVVLVKWPQLDGILTSHANLYALNV